jgi:hypothetical protein
MKIKEEIEKLANEEYKDNLHNPFFTAAPMGYIKGYTKCQEDNKDKKYTEEDLINFAHFYFQENFNSTIQTCKSTQQILQEWFNSLNKQD